VLPPRPGQHADFIAATDAISLLRAARGLPPFDIMLEAKAGDLALLRLRADVARLAPELVALLG
jgi:UV DNA damage endonuclease